MQAVAVVVLTILETMVVQEELAVEVLVHLMEHLMVLLQQQILAAAVAVLEEDLV
jgi:hypothetical protein